MNHRLPVAAKLYKDDRQFRYFTCQRHRAKVSNNCPLEVRNKRTFTTIIPPYNGTVNGNTTDGKFAFAYRSIRGRVPRESFNTYFRSYLLINAFENYIGRRNRISKYAQIVDGTGIMNTRKRTRSCDSHFRFESVTWKSENVYFCSQAGEEISRG